jgi:hypothetical protein
VLHLAAGESIPPARLGAIDFLSARVGVALTAHAIPCQLPDGGVVLRPQSVRLAVTSDGGTHWVVKGRPIPSSPSGRNGLYVVEDVVAASTSVVWALDDEGALLETKDGGGAWTIRTPQTPVEQVARMHNWVWALSCKTPIETPCASTALERTPISGGRWQRAPVPWTRLVGVPSTLHVEGNDLEIVEDYRATHGSARLLVSSDAGDSWSSRRLPGGPGGLCNRYPEFSTDGPTDWWLMCVGQGALGSSTKALMRSEDDGRTWTTVASVLSLTSPRPAGSLSPAEPAALATVTPHRLWFAGPNTMTESSDGGTTWSAVRGVNPEGSVVPFDVLSPRVAWLLAPGTGLWTTSDGTRWRALGAVQAI